MKKVDMSYKHLNFIVENILPEAEFILFTHLINRKRIKAYVWQIERKLIIIIITART